MIVFSMSPKIGFGYFKKCKMYYSASEFDTGYKAHIRPKNQFNYFVLGSCQQDNSHSSR